MSYVTAPTSERRLEVKVRMHRVIQMIGYLLIAVGSYVVVSGVNHKHDQAMAAISNTAKAVNTVKTELHANTKAIQGNTIEINQVRRATEEVVQGSIDKAKFDTAAVKTLRVDAKLPPAIVVKNNEAKAHYDRAKRLIADKKGIK